MCFQGETDTMEVEQLKLLKLLSGAASASAIIAIL